VIGEPLYIHAQRGGRVGIGMKYRPIIFAAALACGAVTPAMAGGARAVIELFTSQGCSSCPPADRLLGELAHDPTLVTMSLPVDYWDYLGWRDTLALHGHSLRQNAYAAARGDRDVATPQAVINGVVAVIGSDKAAIEHAIVQTDRADKPLALPVALTVADGTVTVSVPAATDEHRSGEVWLCPITGKVPVAVGRGENRGRTLTYTNVVRRRVKLGEWDGKARTFSYQLADLPNKKFSLADIDRLDVLVQSGAASKPGLMLGAATAQLPAAAVR
jgi:hypothetical protein